VLQVPATPQDGLPAGQRARTVHDTVRVLDLEFPSLKPRAFDDTIDCTGQQPLTPTAVPPRRGVRVAPYEGIGAGSIPDPRALLAADRRSDSAALKPPSAPGSRG
jgi:hypothetical protein